MERKIISIIGMDGTGKSTVIERIKKEIKCETVYFGRGKHNILPIQAIGKPYKKFESKKNGFVKKIIYTMACSVFALDLLIRYYLKVVPKKGLIITDRFSSDILLMKNVPMPFKKFLYFFLPKPDKTIYLWNEPEVLIKRRPDHELEDLQRQKKIFDEVLDLINPIKIKSENKEQVYTEVISILE